MAEGCTAAALLSTTRQDPDHLCWRPFFAGDVADRRDAAGKPQPHDERGRVPAAGSITLKISAATW